jgi:hypothetical protein
MNRWTGLLLICWLATWASPVLADAKTQAAREVVEYVLQRFGRQAVREGTEVLAQRIEMAAARHGGDVLEAVRKVGPRALPLLEEAGVHSRQAAAVLARHGEQGASWIVARPTAMSLVARHGEGAAAVLVKHAGVAEPVVEKFGARAVRALEATGGQGGRRLAMMTADGELTRIGRSEELLEVVAKYGDRAMNFVWDHKGALAVTATLTAFLANPEPFLDGVEKITDTVAQNAVRPLAEVPAAMAREAAGEVARRTNWTLLGLGIIAAATLLAAGKWKLFASRRGTPASVASSQAPPPAPG